jgi:deoxyribodipyrimidine photo-lyase
VWFRRDLRLDDNPAVAAASSAHDELVALSVLDGRLLDRAGPFRRRQLLANLTALDADLRARGGRLRVRVGNPVDVVPAEAAGCAGVYWNDDVSPFSVGRDDAVAARLGARPDPVPVQRWWGQYVHAPGTVRTGKGTLSRVFTPFSKVWSARPWDPWPVAGPGRWVADGGDVLPPLDADPPMPPGTEAAEHRLAAFAERADAYLEERDRMDLEATASLSVDLRFGTLAARHVAEVVGETSAGRRGFVRQLAWRDWYAHLLAEDPALVDRPQRREYERIPWSTDDESFTAWCEGRTGYPVVDAALRALRRSGSMHNRARMIAASFLVKDLLIDWRRGERWFRHWLTDADVAQNVGNWQWVAGTGPDAAPYFRIFNPVAQSRRFDPAGAYIRRWVPELARLDDRWIHAPWEAPPLDLAAGGVVLGDTYPVPIVDHRAARDHTLAAYKAARSGGNAPG